MTENQISFSDLPSANWRKRFLSMLYESVLLFGLIFLAGYIFDTLTQSKHALLLRHIRMLWIFFVLGCYFVWCWRRGGQTLPMKTWHIRLVSESSNGFSLQRVWLRYVFGWLWVLPSFFLTWVTTRFFILSLAWFFLWLMLNIAFFLWLIKHSCVGQLWFDRWLGFRVVYVSPSVIDHSKSGL